MSKWIKVEDRLPEIGQEVLMRVKVCNRFVVIEGSRRYEKDEWVDCFCSRKNFKAWDGELCYPVTHWMPLPELPKEDDSIKLKPAHKTVIRIEE